MNRSYQVTISDATLNVRLNEAEMASEGGVSVPYEIIRVKGRQWVVRIGSRMISLVPLATGGKNDVVKFYLDGRYYEAMVLDERSLLLKSLKRSSAPVGRRIDICAPMPGFIARIDAEKGKQIQAGEGLLILEAMKMENEIRSPEHGIILDVLVTSGRPVEKGETLVIIEPTASPLPPAPSFSPQ